MSMDETAALKQKLLKLQDENGKLQAKIERLELERDKSDSMMTIHGLTAMILKVDNSGNVKYINSSMETTLGIKREKFINRSITALDAHLGKGFLKLIFDQALKSGETITADHNHLDPNTGTMRYLKITATYENDECQIVMEDQSHFKKLESTFKRYVSPKVIDDLIKGEFDLFKPQKYELTVLFADLRGFTKLCTNHTPEQVKWIIDRFLGVMMKIIIQHEATVDKIIGDEIMALFGAPIKYEDHAVRAVDTAIKMQQIHQGLMEEWKNAGLKNPPRMGIGINTGEMIVGNIGSDLRMDYTVLGHHVNLASRLCSAAKGGDVLISPRTFELTKVSLQQNPKSITRSVKFKSAPQLKAKGILQPINPINVTLA